MLRRSKLALAKIARICESTDHAVKRVKLAFEEGGLDKVGELKWGAGARIKHKLEMEEVDWLTDPETLKRQVHMSLAQRAAALKVQFGKKILPKDVRDIYRGLGITKQRFRSALGPPNPTTLTLHK